jgi:hypothetical protein
MEWRKTTRHSKGFSKPSLTKASQGETQNINNIIAKWRRTGQEPADAIARKARAVYADFSTAGDLMDALNSVEAAYAAFEELPPATRSLFSNDPAALMHFLDDPKNALEGYARGLLAAEDLEAMGVPVPDERPEPIHIPQPVKAPGNDPPESAETSPSGGDPA